MGSNKIHIVLLMIVFTATMLSSCEKETDDPIGNMYKIFKGENFCTPKVVSPHAGASMRFKAFLDDSLKYTIDEPFPIPVNKLYGFSDCTDHHQENGARFGWKWEALTKGGTPVLQIFAYTYVDEKRIYEYMGNIPLNKWHEFAIVPEGETYKFEVSSQYGSTLFSKTMKRGCSGGGGLRYKDGPYFGGEKPAPHEMTFIISD